MSPRVRHRSSRFWSIGKNLFDSTELDKCVYAVSLERFDELRLVCVTSISQTSTIWVPSFKVDLAGNDVASIDDVGDLPAAVRAFELLIVLWL